MTLVRHHGATLGLLSFISLLMATALSAQPLTGGALETLEIEAKAAGVSATLGMGSVCALDADRLEGGHTCVGVPLCLDNSGAACTLPGGLDHVAAGIGLRNSGQGVIQLRGAPTGAVPVAAWLYWGIITAKADEAQAHRAVFNGSELTGEKVGTAAQPCWFKTPPASLTHVFEAYRAEVLPLVRQTINHDYAVSVPISAKKTGEDPWASPGPPPYVEGASLLVVYSHGSLKRSSWFYLHDGAELLLDELRFRHELDPPLPAVKELRHTRLGADGQRRAGYYPTAAFRTIFAATGIADKQISGPGSLIDPTSDWQGADGGPINQLWDTRVTLVPLDDDEILEGLSEYQIGYKVEPNPDGRFYYDCVAVIAHAMTAR